jgi:hypothetical protein
MQITKFYLILILFFLAANVEAQRGQGKGHPGNKPPGGQKVIVKKKSPFRPAGVSVFHPHWHPGVAFHSRWVYFPRPNLYWDNWRNHYVFWNGTIWVSQTKAPPSLKNVDLKKEKQKELREDEDDLDDVYKSNEQHKKRK